ncbi:MAG: hypothetical protein ACREJC_22785 [Tepidisphaeraceae bacterium]
MRIYDDDDDFSVRTPQPYGGEAPDGWTPGGGWIPGGGEVIEVGPEEVGPPVQPPVVSVEPPLPGEPRGRGVPTSSAWLYAIAIGLGVWALIGRRNTS